jgi:hypothetical protein
MTMMTLISLLNLMMKWTAKLGSKPVLIEKDALGTLRK